jgi:hypothetical protein
VDRGLTQVAVQDNIESCVAASRCASHVRVKGDGRQGRGQNGQQHGTLTATATATGTQSHISDVTAEMAARATVECSNQSALLDVHLDSSTQAPWPTL